MIEFIKNISKNKNSEFPLEIDKVYKSKNLKETLDEINEYGFSEKIKLVIEKDEPKNVVKYFDKADYYDGHIPFFGPKKKYNINPDSAYKSYDYETQLNNSTLLKICINENIIKLAERYLKCPPKIYSINTFKNRIKLNKKNQIILKESKFKEVLSFFDLIYQLNKLIFDNNYFLM